MEAVDLVNVMQATGGTEPPAAALNPACNEARFIGSVVLKARRSANQAIVLRQAKQGTARERQAQASVLLDGDGQHDAAEIPALLEPILADEADLAVRSRFLGVGSYPPQWSVGALPALHEIRLRASGFAVESEMPAVIKEFNLSVA